MSKHIDILGKIGILNRVKDDEIKTNIKILHVFRDFSKKINVILITNEDIVYCFGANNNGNLGFGHNNSIDEFTINKELNNKKIVDFKNNEYQTIARTSDGKLYSWGIIRCFGNEEVLEISKPQLNEYLINVNIIGMCLSENHALVLTSNKEVYSWSHNQSGKIGIKSDDNYNIVPKPYKLNEFNGEEVKMISCGSNHSIALTERGHVFSWGHGYFDKLDIQTDDNLKAQVIIQKISCGQDYSLLLSEEGDIYVFRINNNSKLKFLTIVELNQSTLIKLKHSEKFIDIAANYRYNISAALSVNDLYFVWGKCENGLFISDPEKTQFKSFDEIFVILTENNNSFGNENGKYTKYFDEIGKELGKGSYGKVFKVGHKLIGNTFFAMKKIKIFSRKYSFDESLKELDILSFLKYDNEFLVKYYDGWFEQDFQTDGNREYANKSTIYIQMDLCEKNLSDFYVEVKKDEKLFSNNLLTKMGYFVLSEMFAEILEGVGYLHSNNIIHRDLHPDNILVKIRSNGNCIKIADFGLAKFHEMNKLHTKDKGHPNHTAQEVIRGRDYDTKADIYSLGVTLQDLFDITFNNEYMSDIISKYKYLEEICGNMMHVNPRIRPECKEILDKKVEWGINENDFKLKEELFYYLNLSVKSYVQEVLVSKLLQKYSKLSIEKCSDNWVEIRKLGQGSYGRVFQFQDRFCENTVFAMKKEPFDRNHFIEYLKIPEFINYSSILQHNNEFLVKIYDVWIELNILDVLKPNNEFLVKYHDGWFGQKFQLINGIRKLTSNSTLYIQMDLCDKTLKELSEEIKEDSKLYSNNSLTQLGYYFMSELFIEILKGVKYLHNNKIIHLDLNPSNILVKLQKNGNCIKVADFALATLHEINKEYTQDVGHIKYMAPEVEGSRCYDTRADIYSLGVILKELFDIDFNGSFKYGNDFPHMSSKYKYLEGFYEKMTQTNPRKRPNCEELLDRREKWAINESELHFEEELKFLLKISYENRSYVQNIIISKLSHIKHEFYLSF